MSSDSLGSRVNIKNKNTYKNTTTTTTTTNSYADDDENQWWSAVAHWFWRWAHLACFALSSLSDLFSLFSLAAEVASLTPTTTSAQRDYCAQFIDVAVLTQPFGGSSNSLSASAIFVLAACLFVALSSATASTASAIARRRSRRAFARGAAIGAVCIDSLSLVLAVAAPFAANCSLAAPHAAAVYTLLIATSCRALARSVVLVRAISTSLLAVDKCAPSSPWRRRSPSPRLRRDDVDVEHAEVGPVRRRARPSSSDIDAAPLLMAADHFSDGDRESSAELDAPSLTSASLRVSMPWLAFWFACAAITRVVTALVIDNDPQSASVTEYVGLGVTLLLWVCVVASSQCVCSKATLAAAQCGTITTAVVLLAVFVFARNAPAVVPSIVLALYWASLLAAAVVSPSRPHGAVDESVIEASPALAAFSALDEDAEPPSPQIACGCVAAVWRSGRNDSGSGAPRTAELCGRVRDTYIDASMRLLAVFGDGAQQMLQLASAARHGFAWADSGVSVADVRIGERRKPVSVLYHAAAEGAGVRDLVSRSFALHVASAAIICVPEGATKAEAAATVAARALWLDIAEAAARLLCDALTPRGSALPLVLLHRNDRVQTVAELDAWAAERRRLDKVAQIPEARPWWWWLLRSMSTHATSVSATSASGADTLVLPPTGNGVVVVRHVYVGSLSSAALRRRNREAFRAALTFAAELVGAVVGHDAGGPPPPDALPTSLGPALRSFASAHASIVHAAVPAHPAARVADDRTTWRGLRQFTPIDARLMRGEGAAMSVRVNVPLTLRGGAVSVAVQRADDDNNSVHATVHIQGRSGVPDGICFARLPRGQMRAQLRTTQLLMNIN